MSHFHTAPVGFRHSLPRPTVTFGAFKDAFAMAAATELKVTDGEKAMLADMVSRMDPAGRGQALELLLARGFPQTYLQVSRAAWGASVSFNGFRDGVRMAQATDLSLGGDEVRALADAFRRLSPADKQQALAFVQQANLPELYRACAGRAPFTATTVDSFKSALDMAQATELRITDDEQAMLADSFGRLDYAGQSAALELLLARNQIGVYEAAASVSDMARMSLKGFTDGVNMASATELRMTERETRALVDAFRRLPWNEQDQALQLLAKRNLTDLYAACAQARW